MGIKSFRALDISSLNSSSLWRPWRSFLHDVSPVDPQRFDGMAEGKFCSNLLLSVLADTLTFSIRIIRSDAHNPDYTGRRISQKSSTRLTGIQEFSTYL